MKWMIRYWNQNRRQIIIIIAIVVFIFFLIQITNMLLKQEKRNLKENAKIDNSKPIQSVITGEKVKEEVTDENTKIIDDFIQYCNNKEYEKAFSLLTEECKKEFQNNINVFKTNYYNHIFKTKKTYNIQLWLNVSNTYTYQVKYYEDNLLATGDGNITKNIEDYITIVKENAEKKININGFIRQQIINKSKEMGNIELIINSKKIYKNYETYNITIKNRSQNTILISEGKSEKDICLLDTKHVEYPAFLSEIPLENLSLKPGYEKNINIRFNKMYNLYRPIEKIQLKNIVINAENKEKSTTQNMIIDL